MEKIRILHVLSRSGGTVISRCLGCMESVLLLSEIHPFGPASPIKQAKRWFNAVTDLEEFQADVNKMPFVDQVELIHKKAGEMGKVLVIRDFTQMDFIGFKGARRERITPEYKSVLADKLSARFEVVQFSVVRNPVDQWTSIQGVKGLRDGLVQDRFLTGAAMFALHAQQTGFVRYEDFVNDPDAAIQTICIGLDIPFDSGYRDKWADYKTISGDTKSEAFQAKEIKKQPEKPGRNDVAGKFATSKKYEIARSIVGY